MDKMNLVNQLPPLLMGVELDQALVSLPEYDPNIISESDAARLIALTDIYNIFVPTQMSREIYLKIYLAMTRSLVKKGDKLAVQQYNENRKLMLNQDYHGTLGGADSFSIVGDSGIGKSTCLSRAIQLISQNKLIKQEKPYMTIIPCVFVQCPFDSSVRSLN